MIRSWQHCSVLSCIFFNKGSVMFWGFRASEHWKCKNGDFSLQQELNWRFEKEPNFCDGFSEQKYFSFSFWEIRAFYVLFSLGSYTPCSFHLGIFKN